MTTIITDGGRAESSHPQERRDCTVRALAIAARLSYDTAHAILASCGRKTKRGPKSSRYNTFMARRNGRALKRSGSVGKFAELHPNGRFIIHVRGHAFALVDGVAYDTMEVSPQRHVKRAWMIP